MKLRISIRDLRQRPRRPQFSILLMLLVVALFGAIFGWRSPVDQKRRLDYQAEKERIEAAITTWERYRQAAIEDLTVGEASKRLPKGKIELHRSSVVNEADEQIAAAKDRLQKLAP